MEAAIRTVNLRKEYKDTVAVEGLNLEIRTGCLFALLGVNGAGKTTTIKMLSGILRPTSGKAYVCGYDIEKEMDRVKEIIGLSTQETSVARNLTVRENVIFYASMYGIKGEEAEARCNELAKKFSFEKVLNKRVSRLSGGYQRKVSIALALVSKPKVLFLDEPTLGLDVIARRELWKIIEELKKDTTVILTTHYLEEAQALSDRVAIMAEGRLLAEGTCVEIMRKAQTDDFEEAFVKIAGGGAFDD